MCNKKESEVEMYECAICKNDKNDENVEYCELCNKNYCEECLDGSNQYWVNNYVCFMCFGDNPWNKKYRQKHNVSDELLKLKRKEMESI
jgi:hypothetical protein